MAIPIVRIYTRNLPFAASLKALLPAGGLIAVAAPTPEENVSVTIDASVKNVIEDLDVAMESEGFIFLKQVP
jgi:hypothetical protein